MAATMTADEIYEQVQALPEPERFRLVERMVGDLSRNGGGNGRRPSWSEIRGIVPYPLLGEDAQAYISRTRQEGDEAREAQLGRSQ